MKNPVRVSLRLVGIASCLYGVSALADYPCSSQLISTVHCEGKLVDHPEYRALFDFKVVRITQKVGSTKICQSVGDIVPRTGSLPLVIGKDPVIDTILEAEYAEFVLPGETVPETELDLKRHVAIFRRPIILNGPVTQVGLIEVAYDKDSAISFEIELDGQAPFAWRTATAQLSCKTDSTSPLAE